MVEQTKERIGLTFIKARPESMLNPETENSPMVIAFEAGLNFMDHEIGTPVVSDSTPTPLTKTLKRDDSLTFTHINGLTSQVKVRPPFPSLAVFNVAAIILSYVSYQDGIQALMNLLCRNTRSYITVHKEILKSFVIEWHPVIAQVIEFGDKSYKWDAVFPDAQ